MKIPRPTLSTKVLFAFALILLPILLVFIVTYRSNKSEIEKMLLDDLQLHADGREEAVLLFLEMHKRRVQAFSSDGFIRDSFDDIVSGKAKGGGALSEYLRRHKLPLDKKVSGISVMGLDGRVVASTDPEAVSTDESGAGFFKKAKGSDALVVEEYTRAGAHELVFATHLHSRITGRTTGVIATFVRLSELNKVFTGEQNRELGASSWGLFMKRATLEAFLVNKDGLMMTRSRFIEDSAMKLRVDTMPVNACIKEKREVVGFYRDYRGVEVGGASMCLSSPDWTLMVEIDRDEMLAPIFTLKRYAIFTAGLTVVLLSGLYLFFSKGVIRQLNALAAGAGRIAGGDYDVRVSVGGGDEIASLAASFNTMARGIKERTEAQARLTAIIESTPDFVATADANGKVLYCNRAGRRILEIGDDEDVSKIKIPETHTEWAGRLVIEQGLPAAARDGYWSGETEFLGRSGRVTPVSQVIMAHRDGAGRVVIFSTVARDITERKRAEEEVRRLNAELEMRVTERTAELTAANRELEAFSYSVAHDLRAPLRIIDGFSQAAIEEHAERLGPEALDHLRRVRAASRRMAALIDDLLELSRVTRAEMRISGVNLSAVAGAVASELRRGEPGRGADFVIQHGLMANGDARLLRVVLENLLGNAWKFTSKRDLAHIEFGAFGSDAGKTVYFVRDNGAGFEMKYVDRLFKPFQRLHTEKDFPGTGIGLATVERVIRRHGGRVWAVSEQDRGTTVYFSI